MHLICGLQWTFGMLNQIKRNKNKILKITANQLKEDTFIEYFMFIIYICMYILKKIHEIKTEDISV